MKKILIPVLASVLLFSCQQEKTAFVDNEKLIQESQEKKDLENQYNSKIEVFTKKKDSIANSLNLEIKEFQIKANSMSQTKAQEAYQVLGQKQQYLQQTLQLEEQNIAKNFQTKIDSLLLKVNKTVEDYGKTNGYTYIFGKNKAGSVLYGSDKNDITQTMIDNLNNKYSEEK